MTRLKREKLVVDKTRAGAHKSGWGDEGKRFKTKTYGFLSTGKGLSGCPGGTIHLKGV